jgi:amidase
VIAADAALDATALAELVARRVVSPEELLASAMDRIERLNPGLNALAQPFYDRARAQIAAGVPAGPFAGVPFLVKDSVIELAGTPISGVHRWFGGAVSQASSTLAQRHAAAGLITLGKTTIPELSLSFTSEPVGHGPARNPWDLTRSPGGSSGGSAAAVAAGLVPMAHGSDGAGSLRVPAAHCGLVGFKPSRMRTPLGPLVAEGLGGMSYAHALTRSVRDSAALLDATAGPETGDPYAVPPPERPFADELRADPAPLRIALTTVSPMGTAVDPEIVAAVERTAERCAELGHRVAYAAPVYDIDALAAAWRLIAGVTALGAVTRASRLTGTDARTQLEPVNAAWLAEAAAASASSYAAAILTVHQTGRRLGAFFTEWDVLLSPVTSAVAPPLGELAGAGLDVDAFNRKFWQHAPFTCAFNASGGPAMSLPLARSAAGLPIGVHFGADFGRDGMLFALAGQLERARPWPTLPEGRHAG